MSLSCLSLAIGSALPRVEIGLHYSTEVVSFVNRVCRIQVSTDSNLLLSSQVVFIVFQLRKKHTTLPKEGRQKSLKARRYLFRKMSTLFSQTVFLVFDMGLTSLQLDTSQVTLQFIFQPLLSGEERWSAVLCIRHESVYKPCPDLS